jgi:uncharacterized protein YdhG (YjbR/CyaY superfamily)
MAKIMRAVGTIDGYLRQFPPEVRAKLAELRSVIRECAPDAREKISYGIPTFELEGNLVHFAGYAGHIGFYPGAAGIANFAKELAGYRTSKGTVQFPLDRKIPFALIRSIVKFRVRQNLARAGSRARGRQKAG